MPDSTSPSDSPGPDRSVRSVSAVSAVSRKRKGFVPVVLATVVTLVLGGASVARAVSAPPLDAHTDLEFSLDGVTWSEAPDPVLGSWGCDLDGGPTVPDPEEAIGGTPGADPCSMAPGESIDRTYHVRSSTDTGRSGLYEVGIGDYVVSDHADFTVSSTISGPGNASGTARLLGSEHSESDVPVEPGSAVTTLELAPGQTALVVDRVSVPDDVGEVAERQSVSPMMWVSFSDTAVVDSDGDGLPDHDENQLGTDPSDPFNRLPDGTVGQRYGPEPFLPTPPPDTELDVDVDTLPPGLRLEDGQLVGTPTSAGTYDIEFTVTMPAGATYTSIRRVVIGQSTTGSVGLPDLFWPIVIIGIIGGGVGSLGSVIGGTFGSLVPLPPLGPGSSGSSPGSADADSADPGYPGSGSGSGPGSASAPGSAGSVPGTSEHPRPQPGHPHPGASPTATAQPGAGEIPSAVIVPRDGAPSEDWARANSQVRGSLAVTGVAAADLLLWALTAAAAGATLVLLASRTRRRDRWADED